MSDLALTTAGRIEVIESIEQSTKLAGAAITAGDPVYAGTNGTWLKADAATNSSGVHIALRSAQIGEGLTAMRVGRLDGYALSALAQNASVYLSDTVGKLATTAPATTSASVVLGRVEAANAQPLGTAPDKILHVACPL
jgi:hypothetical protein